MTLVALANVLQGNRMVERFHADPRVQATELLLQERVRATRPSPGPARTRRRAVAAAGAGGGGAPLPLAAHRLPARPVPLERPLHRGGDQRRRRRQLLPRPGRHPLAPGRHLRSGQPVRLPARRAQRAGLVGDPPPDAGRGRGRPGHLHDGEGHLPAAGRRDRDPARRRRLPRGRRRGAPARGDEPRRPRPARSRSPATPRSCSRRRPTTWPTRPSASSSSNRSTSPRAPRCSATGGRARPTTRRPGRLHVISQEGRTQGPVEWETDRARFLGRGRSPARPAGARREAALRHHRRPARPHREPAPARPARPRRRGPARPSPPGWPPAGRRPWRSPSATTIPAPPPGPSRSPSRTPGAGCTTSASPARRPCSSSGWRRACCDATPRCARAPSCWPGPRSGRRGSGRTASPATSRSCWCGWSRGTTSRWSARSCRRRSTGG